jgi:TatD DNase family protein
MYVTDVCDLDYAGYLCKDKSDNGVRKILEDGLIPLDRLLVETDSPFMYPNTRASKLPAHVKEALTERYVVHTLHKALPCVTH